jgi:hypothetical protein
MRKDPAKASEQEFRRFVKLAETSLQETLMQFWSAVAELKEPFDLAVDADMAKFVFPNGRGIHLCTDTRRFHRPKRTGKPVSVTVFLGAYRGEMDDPEGKLIPCDRAGRLRCCFFGMGEDEAELGLFFVKQLIKLVGKEMPRGG